MRRDIEPAPFPDLASDDLLYAYAALSGWLSALVPAEMYAEGIMRARKAVADRKATSSPENCNRCNAADIVNVPLIRFGQNGTS